MRPYMLMCVSCLDVLFPRLATYLSRSSLLSPPSRNQATHNACSLLVLWSGVDWERHMRVRWDHGHGLVVPARMASYMLLHPQAKQSNEK